MTFFLDPSTQVTVDDFFLRYLGTEGLVLELNQARAAEFELVGRRQVALSGLLSSKPRIILQREPLISTRDGAVVGYVHVEVLWSWRFGANVAAGCACEIRSTMPCSVCFRLLSLRQAVKANLSLVTRMYVFTSPNRTAMLSL